MATTRAVRTEESPEYAVGRRAPASYATATVTLEEHETIAKALAILESTIRNRDVMGTPQAVRDYLRLFLAPREYEVFAVMFLDAQNRLIFCDEMFRGTLTATAVYPREVIREALRHNAAAMILAHNHPSGIAEPSRADEFITQAVKVAAALFDIKVLDHFIVSQSGSCSFAERGLL